MDQKHIQQVLKIEKQAQEIHECGHEGGSAIAFDR